MYRLRAIDFKNFGLLQSATLMLPETGLVLVRGDNRDIPTMGANAVGKSTIPDALTWTWFGRTPRGVRGNAAGTWGAGDAPRVLLRCEDDKGQVVSFYRAYGPERLVEVDGQGSRTHDADGGHLLGLTPDEFGWSVVVGQASQSFVEMTPAARLAAIGPAMGLDYWDDITTQTKAVALDRGQSATDCAKAIAFIHSKAKTLIEQRARIAVEAIEQKRKQLAQDRETATQGHESRRAEHATAQSAFESNRREIEERLQRLVEEQRSLEQQIAGQGDDASHVSAVAAADEEVSRLHARVAAVVAAYNRDSTEWHAYRSSRATECGTHQQRLQSLRDDVLRIRNEIEQINTQLNSDEGPVCPTCGQPWPDREAQLRQRLQELQEQDQRKTEAGVRMADEAPELPPAEWPDQGARHQEVQQAQQDWMAATRRAAVVKTPQEAGELERRLQANLETQRQTTAPPEPPPFDESGYRTTLRVLDEHAAALDKQEEQARQLDAEIAQAEEQYRSGLQAQEWLDQDAETASYWAKHFPKVKLLAADAQLEALSEAATGVLSELGQEGWRLRFASARAGAAGKKVAGLQAEAVRPDGQAAPIQAWSGGERQRLAIAATIALADYTRARRGDPLAVEVWDEPTAHLSTEGIERLIAVLRKRAETRPLLLIDHRAPDLDAFDHIRTVVREGGVSTIQGGDE